MTRFGDSAINLTRRRPRDRPYQPHAPRRAVHEVVTTVTGEEFGKHVATISMTRIRRAVTGADGGGSAAVRRQAEADIMTSELHEFMYPWRRAPAADEDG
jgi:hypothetical protein